MCDTDCVKVDLLCLLMSTCRAGPHTPLLCAVLLNPPLLSFLCVCVGWGWGRVAFWVFILSADPTQIVTSNAVAAPTNKSGRFTAALESSYGCFSACSVRRESSVAAWCLQLQTNSLWVNFTAFLSWEVSVELCVFVPFLKHVLIYSLLEVWRKTLFACEWWEQATDDYLFIKAVVLFNNK